MFSGIAVSDRDGEVLKDLKNRFLEIEISSDGNTGSASCDIVIIALHPPAIKDVLGEIRGGLRPESVLVSLAPKVGLKDLTEALGGFSRIVRMIPNVPALMGAGFNPLAFLAGFSEDGKAGILEIFSCLGDCPVVREEELEAYAVLAAMEPT